MKKSGLLALLLASALATGCSTSPSTVDGEAILMEPGAESNADSVGSIPEDMLSGEEAVAPAEHAEGADPFADLSTEASAGGEATAEAPMASADSASGQAATGEVSWYEVKRGDTLMKIAFSLYGDIDRWKDLKDWNADSVKSLAHLKAGAKLKYEAPAVAFSQEELAHSYLIKTGDTLAGIADEVYGRRNKYKKLQSYNAHLIKNVNRIFAGFNLFYEISAQEIQDAEARRLQRDSAAAPSLTDATLPSAVQPVPAAIAPPAPAPVAAIKGPSPASHK